MAANVRQAVPFFWVTDMDASLRFYVDGLGFCMTKSWRPEDAVRWCWLELDDAVVMLQVYLPGRRPDGVLGQGVTICFQCEDALALYHGFVQSGLSPKRPFVGNGLWVVALSDPDGHRLEFASPTDVTEDSEYDKTLHG